MLLKLSKFCLYAAVFSVIIVVTNTFFPFIGVKYYFFRTAVSLSLLFFFLWWAFEAAKGEVLERFRKIARNPLFIAVSVFVFFYLLASLFAYDSHSAFWSNFERGEGGFQMIHYYLFFLLLSLIIRDKKDWKRIFQLSIIAGVLMILYGALAQLGIVNGLISPYQGGAPSGFWNRFTEARFQGSLGNPAYVAPYLIFTIFYTAYLWFVSQIKKRWVKHLSYGSLFFFLLFFFYVSKTRGALVGLGIATLVFLIYLLISSQKETKKWAIFGLSLSAFFIVLVAVVSFYLSPLCAKSNCSSFAKNLSSNRLLTLSLGNESFQTRLWTWGSAWQGFKERPLLGWGPENFSSVFDKHFDPRHYIAGTNSETWFDRAHSVVFDYLAETGLLGFLSYLAIFVVFYWQLFKKIKLPKPENTETHLAGSSLKPLLTGLIIVLPIGYFIQGLALFDVLPIYLNLFLFLAFSVYQLNKHYEPTL
ncbi:MAG: O-antigen ligase family protein [Patescibacteria group bacterium]